MITIKIPNTDASDYQLALNIRKEVFVLEQNVPAELEVDSFEHSCDHFIIKNNGEALGAGRLRVKDSYIKFERIATVARARGQGVGRNLMEKMLEYAQVTYPQLTPYMHSQLDAVPFYEKLGWSASGDIFYEAGIPHRAMVFRGHSK